MVTLSYLDALKEKADAIIQRLATDDGEFHFAELGISMRRFSKPVGIVGVVYVPVLSVVLQGRKIVKAGTETCLVEQGTALLVRVDLPTVVEIVDARDDTPYLAVSIALNVRLIREISSASESDQPVPITGPFSLTSVTSEIADCISRLIDLLDRPGIATMIGPGIVKELHYWLLVSPHGDRLIQLSDHNTIYAKVASVIAAMRSDCARSDAIPEIAASVGMSPSSFYAHFKAITSFSPAQYRKRLRLLEARRLLHVEAFSATSAALEVGYESVSQFSRDYRDLFGCSPKLDSRRRLRR